MLVQISGELSLLFSHFVRSSGRVHAFEPIPETFPAYNPLLRHLGVPISNLISLPSQMRMAWLTCTFIAPNIRLGTRSLTVLSKAWEIDLQRPTLQKVESTTIDQYCADNNIDHIDLLKVDVEGAEYQVLRGARHMFENRKIGCCIFEFGQTTIDMGNSPQMISDYLSEMNYGIRNIIRHDSVSSTRPSNESAVFFAYGQQTTMSVEESVIRHV